MEIYLIQGMINISYKKPTRRNNYSEIAYPQLLEGQLEPNNGPSMTLQLTLLGYFICVSSCLPLI